MSLSTLFALTFASATIVFGNPLVDRLNVNESDSLSSEELITERRRLRYIWPERVSYFEWPSCVTGLGGCTVMGVINQKLACPFNDDYHWCHQIKDAVYHVGDREGGKCYLALTNCMGCMNPQYRDVRPDALRPVDCTPHRWYGSKVGQYDHMLEDDRQFVYKICVRAGSLIDGIKFYYKTPTDDSYSDFELTESPWYGGGGGAERCFEPEDYVSRVYVKYDNRFPHALIFNGESTQRFGGGGGDNWKSFYGGVLRSVQLYHGTHPSIGYNVITGLKFDWMDDDNADYMIYKMCHNGQFDCGL